MNHLAKIPLLALSFVLALILWVTVQVQENPAPKAPPNYVVPIRNIGLLPTMQVTSPPDKIKVFPLGPSEEWARVKESDISATIDLSLAQPGARSYPVKISVKGDFVGLKWDPQSPEAVVTVDRKISRTVPVRVQTSGELPSVDSWYVPASTYTEPAYITITGPESDVKDVVSARTTLDLSRVVPGKTFTSKVVDLLEAHDHVAPSTVDYEPKSVDIHPGIALGVQARRVYVIPTYKGIPAPGFSIKSVEVSPQSVQIHGQPEELASISYVNVEIDLTNLKQSKTFTATPLMPSPDVFLGSPNPEVTVKVTLQPIAQPPPATKPDAKPKGRRQRSRE